MSQPSRATAAEEGQRAGIDQLRKGTALAMVNALVYGYKRAANNTFLHSPQNVGCLKNLFAKRHGGPQIENG